MVGLEWYPCCRFQPATLIHCNKTLIMLFIVERYIVIGFSVHTSLVTKPHATFIY